MITQYALAGHGLTVKRISLINKLPAPRYTQANLGKADSLN